MMAAHDTDHIAQIPGLPVHPIQAAEQARIAAVLAQNATPGTELVAAPAPESVKDMTSATRQVLENLSVLLKDARPLSPNDASRRPGRAEAPSGPAPGPASNPSLAAAANADAQPKPEPGNSPGQSAPETVLSAGRDDNAANPR